jgi:hypothetical protein
MLSARQTKRSSRQHWLEPAVKRLRHIAAFRAAQHLRYIARTRGRCISGFLYYPNVRVQILVTERFVDHIAEGVDLASGSAR